MLAAADRGEGDDGCHGDVQMPPEERRPVTEDGEAASTHEPARAHDEEVSRHRLSVIFIYLFRYFLFIIYIVIALVQQKLGDIIKHNTVLSHNQSVETTAMR